MTINPNLEDKIWHLHQASYHYSQHENELENAKNAKNSSEREVAMHNAHLHYKYGEHHFAKHAEAIKKLNEDTISERHLTSNEMNKREENVMSMKKHSSEFKKRYGDRWKSVMYAIATKQAENMHEDAKLDGTSSPEMQTISQKKPTLATNVNKIAKVSRLSKTNKLSSAMSISESSITDEAAKVRLKSKLHSYRPRSTIKTGQRTPPAIPVGTV